MAPRGPRLPPPRAGPSSSPAAAAAAGREKSSRRMLAYLLGVAAAMVGASYAAVPLYRRFCQATGYGGTVQRRESVEEKISRHARDGTMTSREIIVQFNADVADGMPWKFIPTQREVRVKPGESALAFYTAENRSSTPITGVSTYNVAPMKGKAKKVVPAQTLWFDILKAQIETGTPYMLYKDTCNRKSNQQNLGTIKSSNLCTEIIEFTSPTETVVCNLASIALPRFVKEKGVPIESHPSKLVGSSGWKNRYFDFDKLAEVTSTVTYNLNKIIDINYYPVETAKRSNIRHRPIGIGVQGLADTFILLGMPFDSPEAQQLNKDIFETIYYHALKASAELAAKEGPYETYEGCPVSKGILQPDMWNVVPSNRWNWPALRETICKVGLRNSLLVAPMPTASTSQILGNNECFEPYTSNIYSRRVLSGEFVVVNKHLLHDLTEMGIWTPTLKNKIIYEDGSVQKMTEIPDDLKAIYKTVWEIKQKTLVDMAVDRGCYIDQSQSLNVHMEQPNFGKLTSLHFHGWSKGLKTGMYYLRTRAAADAIKFTVDTTLLKENGDSNNKPTVEEDVEDKMAQVVCSLNNREECLACGS